METRAHQQLKKLSLRYLRSIGCMAAAAEVRCPISRFRVDAAGYLDSDPVAHLRCPPRVVVIECKQSRQDFLRDRAQIDRLLRQREHLDRVRQSIEEHRIKIEEPDLRRDGTSLFAELDEWDFSASRLPAYRRVLRRLARIDEQLYGQTKFFLMARYRLADRMYIAAPRSMVRPCELPRGWGLLECPPQFLDSCDEGMLFDQAPQLVERAAPHDHAASTERRSRWLRNLAVAASMAAYGRLAAAPAWHAQSTDPAQSLTAPNTHTHAQI